MDKFLNRFLAKAQEMLALYPNYLLPTVDVIVASYRPEMAVKLANHINTQSVKIEQVFLSLQGYTPEQEAKLIASITNAKKVVSIPSQVVDGNIRLGMRHQEMAMQCQSDFFAVMDDDEWYFPNYLKGQLAYLKAEQGVFAGKNYPLGYDAQTAKTGWLFDIPLVPPPFVAGGSMVIKRSLMDDIAFDDIPTGYDATFQGKVLKQGLAITKTDPFNFLVTRNLKTGHTWNPERGFAINRLQVPMSDVIL